MASPPLESLSIASVWPLDLVRIIKDFTFDLGCVAVLGLFVQCIIPQLSLWRRLVLTLPVLLVFLMGFRGMPELWARRIHEWSDSLDRTFCTENVQWLVVLGGGFAGAEQLAASTLSRVNHAAKLVEELPEQTQRRLNLVVAGGPTSSGRRMPESHFMKRALLMRLPWLRESRVIEENTSLNTHDNAVHVGQILRAESATHGVVLVTSQLHMPRAFGAFKTAGLNVCPMASHDVEHVSEGVINFRNADRTVRVINEYLGYLGYRAKGWIQEPKNER